MSTESVHLRNGEKSTIGLERIQIGDFPPVLLEQDSKQGGKHKREGGVGQGLQGALEQNEGTGRKQAEP